MAQLNVRIEDAARSELDALAAARGVGTTELVRSLIDTALGREDSDQPYEDLTPAALSVLDRQRLVLQHRALGLLAAQLEERREGNSPIRVGQGRREVDLDQLADGDPAHHARLVNILEAGYTTEYHRLFTGIQPELSAHQCALVREVLDMFTMLTSSWQRLDESEREQILRSHERAEHIVTFAGFDFNDPLESRLADYAHHLIDDGRWRELAEHFDDRHDHGNSHMRTLAIYQRMLTAFRPILRAKIASGGMGGGGYDLSVREIEVVLAAWPYRA